MGGRPDSGDPRAVLGRVFAILGSKFGDTTSTKGYKVLPECIRVIQGDGISYDSIGDILESLAGTQSPIMTRSLMDIFRRRLEH